MHRFDPNERMTEIHGINETLILIRAGNFMQNGEF